MDEICRPLIFHEQGSRAHMEDFYGVFSYGAYKMYCVADGHGGSNVSNLVITNIGNLLAILANSCNDEQSLHEMIYKNIIKYDQELYDKDKHRFSLQGSTFSGCLYNPTSEKAILINVGDSRTVIFDLDGFSYQTVDHNPDHPTEKARIEANNGIVTPRTKTDVPRVNHMYSVSRSFGDFSFKYIYTMDGGIYYSPTEGLLSAEPDLNFVDLKTKQNVYCICATDGFWNYCALEDLLLFLKNYKDKLNFETFFKELTRNIAAKPGSDNVCVVLTKLK